VGIAIVNARVRGSKALGKDAAGATRRKRTIASNPCLERKFAQRRACGVTVSAPIMG